MSGTCATHEQAAKTGPSAADVTRITMILLRGVERLPGGATGALIFGDKKAPTGTVLVENGRICWAAAEGMERRLTDILVAQSKPPLSVDMIEDVYEWCRRDGTPLGAALVARGVVTPRGLRQALLAHTGEAITFLSRALGGSTKVSPTWVPSRTRRYEAQFTFLPTEILVAVGARFDAARADSARRALQRALDDGGAGAAFPSDEERALPLCEVNGERVGVEGLVALGSWAREALHQSDTFAPASFVAGATASKIGVVGWRRDELIYVAMCEDRSTLSHLVSQRARESRG